MSELSKQIKGLLAKVDDTWSLLDLDTKLADLSKINSQLADPDVWQDNLRAQDLSKSQAKLIGATEPWQKLKKSLQDIVEMSELDDSELEQELNVQLQECQKIFNELKAELRFNVPYDDMDCIVGIFAGAGGKIGRAHV